jgi:hypothetical protein
MKTAGDIKNSALTLLSFEGIFLIFNILSVVVVIIKIT